MENYKNGLKATPVDSKTKYPEKKINIDSPKKKDHKEFIRNNKSRLKTQQRIESEKHHIFTEEINNITGTKLNISLVFITKSYFAVSKNIRLNYTHYFIRKISNKCELQQIGLIIHQTLTLKTL